MCIIKSNISLLQLKEVDGPADEHMINEKYDGQEDCCFKVAKLYIITSLYISHTSNVYMCAHHFLWYIIIIYFIIST